MFDFFTNILDFDNAPFLSMSIIITSGYVIIILLELIGFIINKIKK